MTQASLISVILPLYMNAETLRELHERVRDTLEHHCLPYEIIFVDDASPDSSMSILDCIAQRDEHVLIISLEKNIGQHHAALAGLTYCRGEWAIIMDADLQDAPEAIPHLLMKGQEGFAAVFAGRRGKYDSGIRLLTSRIFKRIIHGLCGVPKDAGMFIAIHRALIDQLLTIPGRRHSLPAMIGCVGLPMISIPIARARRPSGKSAYNFQLRLKNAWHSLSYILMWKFRCFTHDSAVSSQQAFSRQPRLMNATLCKQIIHLPK
jgi:glycosyltransferase involved in cell wall biosynthesis